MKRNLLLVAPLFLAACGGGSLSLDLNSDDAAENTSLSSVRSSLSEAVDLTTVKSVKVTVSEIWAHVEDKDVKTDEAGDDKVEGSKIDDSSKHWVQVSSSENTFSSISTS